MVRQDSDAEYDVHLSVSARKRFAEAAFRRCLADRGALLLEPVYLGNKAPHHAQCASGHDCYPRPADLRRGRGVCRVCAVRDPVTAEAQFKARLGALGAVPLFEVWRGTNRAHHVRCAEGHESWTIPSNLRKGDGICKTCAGNDTVAAERSFRQALAALGATPLFDTWRGVRHPHHVRCAAGHNCYPWPSGVLNGKGICRSCGSKSWDAFYVVTSPLEVKFGITSGTGRYRLAQHARQGLLTQQRLAVDLPDTMALDIENTILAALADAGERPLRGKEYFDISCLALVLDVADGFLMTRSRP